MAALDRRAQLINLINGPSHTDCTHLQPGSPSEGEFRRYLNLGLHAAPTADQDNHKRNWGDATDARTAVLAPALTKAALLTAMRQRRVYATEDRNLRLVYRVNGQLLGSRILGAGVPAAGTALTVSLAITDDNEPNAGYTVEVFSDQIGGNDVASIVRTQSVTGNGMHNITGVSYQGRRPVRVLARPPSRRQLCVDGAGVAGADGCARWGHTARRRYRDQRVAGLLTPLPKPRASRIQGPDPSNSRDGD